VDFTYLILVGINNYFSPNDVDGGDVEHATVQFPMIKWLNDINIICAVTNMPTKIIWVYFNWLNV